MESQFVFAGRCRTSALDIATLGLTLLARWLAMRPANGQATFGYRRVEILAALLNGLSLLAIAALITWEAMARFQAPEPVLGLPMLITAAMGLIVNSLNITLLHQHSHDDLNLRGAFLHVVADAVSSVGVILAALAVYFFNWLWIDAAASLLVAGLTGLECYTSSSGKPRDFDGVCTALHKSD
jgi:cobalt-zinc-cadmium efflux system protein